MDIKRFLDLRFLGFLFLTLDGRIKRKTWWFSQIFLVVVGILILIPIGSVLEALDWGDPEIERFVQFFVLIISFLGVFLDSKRLQDRSINGLVAIIPYVLSVPYQFGLIPENILKGYVLVVLVARVYIFINAGFMKGDEGENKFGPEPNH
jgi:uncharacterized membrane protein YhaH (DUF805 family)|tara:strand:- start:1102 stop:1551 length:450 start_codon:yes stop_codon:yes gene_type:complete